MFINTETLAYPITFELLLLLNQNTSFPPGDFTPPHPYAVVEVSDKPAYDNRTQYVVESSPVYKLGTWTQTWKVKELFATQEERTASIAKATETERLNTWLSTVPQSVTMRQACMQLEVDGLLDDVETIVATLPRVFQIEWQRASTVQRDNPLVEMVRQQQNMTPEQIDALFIKANLL